MVVTVKGKTFPVSILYPLRTVNELMIVYEDNRSISEIAADWENAEHIIAIDGVSTEETMYDGFSILKRMVREEGNMIQIGLAKGGNA